MIENVSAGFDQGCQQDIQGKIGNSIFLCFLLSDEILYIKEIGLVADSLRLGGAILKVIILLTTLYLIIMKITFSFTRGCCQLS